VADRDPTDAESLVTALRGLFLLGALAAASFCVPAGGVAQQTSADTAAILLEAADSLEAEGRTGAAAELRAYLLRRYPGTAAAAEVQRRMAVAPAPIDRSGRIELLVWSTLYGLWLGAAVPAALEADDPEAYGLGVLAGGPAGFFLSKAYTERRPMGEGNARAITLGGSWGTWQGYGWREVLDLGTREECFITVQGQEQCFETDADASTVIAAMIAGGLAGLVAGTAISARGPIAPGTATLANFGALWGSGFATAAGVFLDVEDDPLLATALIGGNAGLLGGALLGRARPMSRGRARLINIAGVVGLLAGVGIDLLLLNESDNEKLLVAVPTATSVLGLLYGAHWTRDYDRNQRRRFEGPGGGALLELHDGRLAFDVPTPVPALLQKRSGRGREAGARIELLRLRF